MVSCNCKLNVKHRKCLRNHPSQRLMIKCLTIIQIELEFGNVGFEVFEVSLLASSSPDRKVWVRALSGDIVLCSWARHCTLTVPLSTQVYKWVLANSMLGVTMG